LPITVSLVAYVYFDTSQPIFCLLCR